MAVFEINLIKPLGPNKQYNVNRHIYTLYRLVRMHLHIHKHIQAQLEWGLVWTLKTRRLQLRWLQPDLIRV